MSAQSDQLSPTQAAEAARICACFNFRRTSRAVTQFYDEILQPCGLRSTQLVILLAAAAVETASLARLARELVLDRSTLTRNLKPLEKQGLIEIAPGRDKRTRLVVVTAVGHRAIMGAVPYWQEAQDRFVSQLGAGRWQKMLEDLKAAMAVTRGIQPSS